MPTVAKDEPAKTQPLAYEIVPVVPQETKNALWLNRGCFVGLALYLGIATAMVLLRGVATGVPPWQAIPLEVVPSLAIMLLIVGISGLCWYYSADIALWSARRKAQTYHLKPGEVGVRAVVVDKTRAVMGFNLANNGGQMRFRYVLEGKKHLHRCGVSSKHYHRHNVGDAVVLAVRPGRRGIRVLDEPPASTAARSDGS